VGIRKDEDIVRTLVKAKAQNELCKKRGENTMPETSVGRQDNWTVYSHTNTINGKKYFGITSQRPELRWRNGEGYRGGSYFYHAIKKYGWDAFSHEVLFTGLTEADAKQKEISLIAEYHTMDERYGYNLTCGGDGVVGRVVSKDTRQKISDANRGRHHTDDVKMKISKALIGNQYAKGLVHTAETKERISASLMGNQRAKGNKLSEETRKRMSEAHIGKTLSEEARRKVAEAHRGMKRSDETRKRISDAKRNKPHKGGYTFSDEAKAKMSASHKKYIADHPEALKHASDVHKIAVDMLTKDGEYIRTFPSALDAKAELGVDNSSIIKVCKAKMKSAGGYLWRYHKEVA